MQPKRIFGAAAVCASAVPAGIIESSNGNAIAAPAPRSTVRRERCFLVTNMAPTSIDLIGASLLRLVATLLHPILHRPACNDALHQRRKTIVVFRGRSHDLAHHRHVVRLERAA